MPIDITVPRLGWNMDEGTFVEWLKADGDAVKPGERLFRLEGEKSVEEVEAFDAGRLSIPPDGPKPGERVAVGKVIGQLLQPDEVPAARGFAPPPPASPAVRRLAREAGVDLQTVRGTGRGGRLTPEDVTAAVTPRARRLARQHGIDCSGLTGTGRNGRVRERDVSAAVPTTAAEPDLAPHTPTRKTIAARMLASRQTTAPVTLTATADASNLVNLREQFKRAGGPPVPAYTDFLLKLAAAALTQHPTIAAEWTDAGMRPAKQIDIGLAVEADAGLLVPVIRDVPGLSLRDLVEQTGRLIDLARRGTLAARDMAGGCFTISSLGGYGVETFTPILNPPQTAILGVGRIQRQPVMDGDRVVGRDQMPLSLTFDHRAVDGGPAARFLQTLVRLVETPGPWLTS